MRENNIDGHVKDDLKQFFNSEVLHKESLNFSFSICVY